MLARQYGAIGTEIASVDKGIMALHRGCEASRRLAEIPGIGPVGATALVAEIGDWKTFSSGRSLAAWIGLVPKQHSTGGKDRLGSITKQAIDICGGCWWLAQWRSSDTRASTEPRSAHGSAD